MTLASDTAAVLARCADEPALLGGLYDAGLAWVHFPTGWGGRDLPASDQATVDAVLDDAGRRPDWERNPMGVGMIGPAIAVHGDSHHRSRLRAIFTGEEQWCQLFSEPGAGSDLASLSTRAVRTDGGDGWVLDGQKVWTSNAPASRWALALARTDPAAPKHRGITAFVVDMHAPGVTVRAIREMTGAARFSEVFLDGVVVPDADRLGAVGDGWTVARTTLSSEREAIGGEVDPPGEGEITAVLKAWAGGAGPMRDQVAQRWIEAEVVRLLKLRMRTAAGDGSVAAVLKLAEATTVQRIRATAVALLGADAMVGLTYDEPAEDDSRHRFLLGQANTIAGGTSEILRDLLGERILGLPRSR